MKRELEKIKYTCRLFITLKYCRILGQSEGQIEIRA